MKKRVIAVIAVLALSVAMFGCKAGSDTGNGKKQREESAGDMGTEGKAKAEEETEIQVFIAASLNTVMTELAKEYQKDHPNVKIIYNADSSGTLLTQIEEGYECDLFFSAAQKQMDVLEADGFLVDGTRSDVVNNQVVVITLKDSKTKVKGLANLQDAESIALAGGSVPVGKYTRQALVNMGIIHTSNDPDSITAQEISEAFGGVEISEQDNVSKVLMAVAEGSCEDDIKILEKVSSDLTGDVIYPIAQIVNKEADKKQTEAAEDFMDFLLSDEAAKVFESYYFDTDIK